MFIAEGLNTVSRRAPHKIFLKQWSDEFMLGKYISAWLCKFLHDIPCKVWFNSLIYFMIPNHLCPLSFNRDHDIDIGIHCLYCIIIFLIIANRRHKQAPHKQLYLPLICKSYQLVIWKWSLWSLLDLCHFLLLDLLLILVKFLEL